jgi:hypothetical protein
MVKNYFRAARSNIVMEPESYGQVKSKSFISSSAGQYVTTAHNHTLILYIDIMNISQCLISHNWLLHSTQNSWKEKKTEKRETRLSENRTHDEYIANRK